MKYSKFKTKTVFSFSIYYFIWRYSIACSLRDDFGVDVDPGSELLLSFVPVYGLIRWWGFLKQIQALQQRLGMQTVMSPARAFWISSFWFGSGPYVNRHMNALYEFRAGRAAGAVSTPIQVATQPAVPPMDAAPSQVEVV